MGTAALLLTVGGESNQKINMYKLAIFCVAIVGAFAAPNAEADADAYYGYGYYPYYRAFHYPGFAGHPGAATSFVARSPQGLGKRSADAEAEADAHYGYYGYGHRYGYYGGYRGYYGYPYGYRYHY